MWHWFGNLHHHILIIVFLQGAVYWKRNPKLFQKTNNQTKTVAVGEAWEGHKSLYEGLKKILQLLPWLQPQTAVRVTEVI